jgi:Fe-S-cluster containining protein
LWKKQGISARHIFKKAVTALASIWLFDKIMKITHQTIQTIGTLSAKRRTMNELFFKKISKKNQSIIDEAFHRLHEQVFEEIDCLDCGNCCKSLGPRITDADIRRISTALKIKPSDFTDKYLRLDEENDYVFRQIPCPFLDGQNYCGIYENRPRACREYPHTDRRRMSQIIDITLKNASTCPAVFEIIERLKSSGI